MKNKNTALLLRVLMISMSAIVIFLTTILYFIDAEKNWFYFIAPIPIIVCLYTLFKIITLSKTTKKFLRKIVEQLSPSESGILTDFPLPVIVCGIKRRILWYNEPFRNDVLNGQDIYGDNFDALTAAEFGDICSNKGKIIKYNNKFYNIFGIPSVQGESELYMILFFDVTEAEIISNEYMLSRPSVMLINIDNYEELFGDAKESDKSRFIVDVDRIMEDFIGATNGTIKKLKHDRFIAIVEERHLTGIIENRFNILDKVREMGKSSNIPLTLSIGVGWNACSIIESEKSARQALDMALGRGGDQVAVKTQNGYDFYGGISKEIEKQNKGKARIVGNSLLDLINSSSGVLLMGHMFGDLDSVGSAIGLSGAVKLAGKPVGIAVDYNKNLARHLIDRINEVSGHGLFLNLTEAMNFVNDNTLLIILDTHNPERVESRGIYNACKTRVVIDHHRRTASHIDDAVIFYNQPYSSSASEMVSELLPHMEGKPTKEEAQALMAGIMLDTKNFTIRAGVRTFEAAAYLKRCGADTVEVKKLFATSVDAYKKKAHIIASAEIYRKCAISCSEFKANDIKIISSQAADELLNIQDIDASFVIFKTTDRVEISARSYGALNVQLIMEYLGGGGHQTMAAAQLDVNCLDEAKTLLTEAIDKYFN